MQHLALPSTNEHTELQKFEVDGNTYVLMRVAEFMLYGTPQSNGAFAKAIQKHNLPQPVPVSAKTYAEVGVTKETFDAMLSAFKVFYSTVDPSQTSMRAPTKFSIVSVESVATIARAKHDQHMLQHLGHELPREWVLEAESQELATNGYVDLVLEDELQEFRDESVVPLSTELGTYEPFVSNNDEDAKVAPYTLHRQSRHLSCQLEHFINYQTAKLHWMRAGGAVASATAEADTANFLRFAGWRVASGGDMHCLSAMLMLEPDDMQAFCEFLVATRKVLHGTVANYMNSLLNVLRYVEANVASLESLLGVPMPPGRLQSVMTAARNLRQQAESEAKQEKLYKPRKENWIAWDEAKTTRERACAAVAAMDPTSSRASKLKILEDALIICFHTVMPPDRVGVIRRLAFDETVKKRPDSEDYYIDLSNFKHKTAKFYGPSMTPISKVITPYLQKWLDATQSGFEFQEYDEHEERLRTRRRYLFAMPTDATRCHSTANWTARVKAAFGRYHPEGKAPCPSLLRSSFITELKNSTENAAILGAAAIAQKHSTVMQGSNTYDLDTHIRATKAAMEWCDQYATGTVHMDGTGADGEHERMPPTKRPRIM